MSRLSRIESTIIELGPFRAINKILAYWAGIQISLMIAWSILPLEKMTGISTDDITVTLISIANFLWGIVLVVSKEFPFGPKMSILRGGAAEFFGWFQITGSTLLLLFVVGSFIS